MVLGSPLILSSPALTSTPQRTMPFPRLPHFWRMEGPPRTPEKKRRRSSKRCSLLWWKPLPREIFVVDDEASPETTSLEAEDEDSVFLFSKDYKSSDEIVKRLFQEEHASMATRGRDIKLRLELSDRMRRLLSRLKRRRTNHRRKSRSKSILENFDLSSSYQSVVPEEARSCRVLEKGASVTEIECVFERDMSRVSLGDFLGQRRPSLAPPCQDFASLPAQDSASVASAYLGVSFDDDYAQLILKASSDSIDGQTDLIKELLGYDDAPLGASYPHPASSTVPSSESGVPSSDVTESSSECSQATTNISDRSSRHVMEPKLMYCSRVHRSSASPRAKVVLDSIDATSDSKSVMSLTPAIKTQDSDWNMGWSFSHDDSIVSFGSILGDAIYGRCGAASRYSLEQ